MISAGGPDPLESTVAGTGCFCLGNVGLRGLKKAQGLASKCDGRTPSWSGRLMIIYDGRPHTPWQL